MWPDLYRCSVIQGTVAICLGLSGLAAAQEIVPVPNRSTADQTNGFAGTLDRLHDPLLRTDLKVTAAASCATSNCHAGPRPGVLDPTARRSMEYQLWVERDPHAQSWRTICSDESVAMMKRLGIIDGDRIVDRVGFDNCLACHNSTRRFDEPRWTSTSPHASANSFLREGVGCSACHGPSEQWISTHFQSQWSAQGASAEGFVEAGDLYVRARMCASCHVGDKDRDMNHDIIAAGHPSLRYELATFHAWQPKHWRDSEADDKTAYEAQLWLAGQVASTDASLSLLETRANDAHTVSQWPEFAAYNCASCHHNLGLDNSRQPFVNGRRASAIYSQWNDAGLRWLVDFRIASGEANEEDFELKSALDHVKQQMETRPRPSAEGVAQAAGQARQSLARWFDGKPGVHERFQFRSGRLGRVIADAAGKPDTFASWESAVQFYLAAVAARESWPGGWDGPLRNVADRMQNGLQYPQMIDISRYSKRSGAKGPEATRMQTMAMGIELAGWLGPVVASPIDESSDEAPQDVRRRMNQMIDEINSRWKEKREQRNAARQQAEQAKPDTIEAPTRRQPKSAEELLQERERARNENADPNGSP